MQYIMHSGHAFGAHINCLAMRDPDRDGDQQGYRAALREGSGRG